LDTVGPLTKTVEDMAIVMQAISGQDDRDSTTPNVPVENYTTSVDLGKTDRARGMKFGLPREYMELEGLHPGIAARLQELVTTLTKAGAEVVEVSLPHTKYAVPTYYIIVPSEVSSNMARYDGIKYGYRAEVGDIDMVYAQSRSEGL